MKAEKLPASPEVGGFKLVGLDAEAKEVYFPETGRSYVLADMTACQLEQLYRLGSKHVDKVQA